MSDFECSISDLLFISDLGKDKSVICKFDKRKIFMQKENDDASFEYELTSDEIKKLDERRQSH